MSDMPTTPRHGRRIPRWMSGQNALAASIITGCAALAAPTFIVLFLTVTNLLRPSFHEWAWTVPVSTETGFVVVYLADIYLEMRDRPARWLRYVSLPFVAASVWLNVYAAHGRTAPMVGHAVVTLTFFGTLAIAKMCARRLIRARSPQAGRIPRARWLLSPVRTAGMKRRMVLHNVTSYPVACAREEARLAAISLMPAVWGDGWRKTAPPLLRHHLASGTLPADLAMACSAASPGYIPATGELAETWVTNAKMTVTRARAKARQQERETDRQDEAPADRQRKPSPDRRKPVTEAARKRAKVERLLTVTPDLPLAEVVAKSGVSESTVLRVKREMADRPKPLTAVR